MKKLLSLSLIVLFAACGGKQNKSVDALIEQGDVNGLKAAKEAIKFTVDPKLLQNIQEEEECFACSA